MAEIRPNRWQFEFLWRPH